MTLALKQRRGCQRVFGLIQCYLTLLYESIKLMVPDQPRENAHKTETNWEIIVLVNWSKSSITHNVLNLFYLTQQELSHPKYWWPSGTNCDGDEKQRKNSLYQIIYKDAKLKPVITAQFADWTFKAQTNTLQLNNYATTSAICFPWLLIRNTHKKMSIFKVYVKLLKESLDIQENTLIRFLMESQIRRSIPALSQ